MKIRARKQYEARARVAKALAHPSRLLMLDALSQDELCVHDLTGLVGADQSTVSKHLAVLRHAGLVDLRKEGAMTFYRLKVPCLEGFWSCIETVLSKSLEEQKKALQA
ncbi:MAG: ArsR/SmtB family transcription factor [Planctomycetota bacterium]|jgi:ArsR family transcriptional regulator